ncbi:hypothetical protein C5C24_08610 [Rathayibacter sp. AY2B3]|nr:hypothetical protein C5C24_08610 [Rathayibacter sp. AY2B3]
MSPTTNSSSSLGPSTRLSSGGAAVSLVAVIVGPSPVADVREPTTAGTAPGRAGARGAGVDDTCDSAVAPCAATPPPRGREAARGGLTGCCHGRSLPERPAEPSLSAVQRSILQGLAAGLTDEALAARLDLSVRTCRRHIAGLFDLLGAESRFQAGVLAARQGWLPVRPR